jgi:hypothetical protein
MLLWWWSKRSRQVEHSLPLVVRWSSLQAGHWTSLLVVYWMPPLVVHWMPLQHLNG